MGSKTEALCGVLDELVALLDGAGEVQWAARLHVVQARLRASEFSGITHLLAACGGIGSFNDLILGQGFENGEFVWQPGHRQNHERLDTLLSQDLENRVWAAGIPHLASVV